MFVCVSQETGWQYWPSRESKREGSLWESLKFLWTKYNQFNLIKSTFDMLEKVHFVDNKFCAHSPFMVGGLLFSFFPFLFSFSNQQFVGNTVCCLWYLNVEVCGKSYMKHIKASAEQYKVYGSMAIHPSVYFLSFTWTQIFLSQTTPPVLPGKDTKVFSISWEMHSLQYVWVFSRVSYQ